MTNVQKYVSRINFKINYNFVNRWCCLYIEEFSLDTFYRKKSEECVFIKFFPQNNLIRPWNLEIFIICFFSIICRNPEKHFYGFTIFTNNSKRPFPDRFLLHIHFTFIPIHIKILRDLRKTNGVGWEIKMMQSTQNFPIK